MQQKLKMGQYGCDGTRPMEKCVDERSAMLDVSFMLDFYK